MTILLGLWSGLVPPGNHLDPGPVREARVALVIGSLLLSIMIPLLKLSSQVG